MIEAARKGALHRQRTTKTYPTIEHKLIAPLEQQAQYLEEVLVPAHRDPVFGDPAEAGTHALIESLLQFGGIANQSK